MNVGAKIRDARIAKGLTQEQLGDLIGVQKSAVAKYENGRVVNIKRSTLKKISSVLEIKPSELFFEDDKTDVAVDIVVRLGKDKEFCELVKMLNTLDSEQLSSVKAMLSAFLKQ